jgi:homoserine dehydrogenase
VVADVVDVARTLTAEPRHRVPYLAFHPDTLSDHPVKPIEEIQTAYYLRMSALDKPGVLSQIAQILSNAGISIEALIQKQPAEDADHVPVILLTNVTREKSLMAAVEQIQALDSIAEEVVRIRVESLAG